MKDEYIFRVFFERADDGGYVASVPVLPSCYATGPTLETARQRIAEAIRCYCLNQLELGGSIPPKAHRSAGDGGRSQSAPGNSLGAKT